MKHANFCKQCGTENSPEVRYCQGCGAWLDPRPPLLDSLDLRWLAGVGRRDVNVAPLFTAEPAPGPAARATGTAAHKRHRQSKPARRRFPISNHPSQF